MFNDAVIETKAQRLDKTLLTMLRADMPLPLKVIATRQGLKVTPYIRNIMQRLGEDGQVAGEMRQSNGFQVYFYWLTDEGRRTAEAVLRLVES